MKNNFRIINFLRKLFYFLFILITLKLAAGVCVNIVTLFFPSFPITAGDIHFYGEAYLKPEVSYKLLGGDFFTGQSDIALRMKGIESENLFYRIFRLIDFLIVNLLVYFSLKNVSRLFTDLSNNHQTDAFFSWDNYRIIKRIAFLLFGLWTYALINGLLFSFLFVNDVVVQGMNVSFHPSLGNIPGFVTVLIVLVFAEIYRSGIDLKEEAEYTI
ncbi:DUF2975 domain-containing protein [Ancylomarina salipaludis]|uniref:DUF2975 domain-containing protein n=1 Tax=Ancylomarina salipaludis TaxID=2501299 RepID=A0A4Q1JQS1_9BACT|nr:DUF2975 domain-containing protein [Ancylomarina salipaludis]RXQ97578.1 DUF2975 domain-containing protein [Ancylomarina salipaludis]